MALVYRIRSGSGHTYVGMTEFLPDRILYHAARLRRGLLGSIKVDRTDVYDVEILIDGLDWSEAYAAEYDFILADKLQNPLNCNRSVNRSVRYKTNGPATLEGTSGTP